MIHETLPHSYTLKHGQDYELWFPDFFTIKESTWKESDLKMNDWVFD